MFKNRWSPGCNCCGSTCGTIAVTVRLCSDNSLVSGAFVTIADSTGATVGSGTTTGTGIVTVTILAAGNYDITVSKSGQTTLTRRLAATCTANAVTLGFGRAYQATVRGCNGIFLPGAIATVTLSGNSYSGVSNSAGVVTVPVPSNGTYAVNIHDPSGRFNDYNGTMPILGCFIASDGNRALLAASGYKCVSWGDPAASPPIAGRQCLYPYATTLYLTDSIYGAVTLTWTAATHHPFANQWYGIKTVTVPACDACPAATTTMEFLIPQTQSSDAVVGMTLPDNGTPLGCPGGADTGSYRISDGYILTNADVACPPSPVVTAHIPALPLANVGFCTASTAVITE